MTRNDKRIRQNKPEGRKLLNTGTERNGCSIRHLAVPFERRLKLMKFLWCTGTQPWSADVFSLAPP